MTRSKNQSKFETVFEIVDDYIKSGLIPCAVLGYVDSNKNTFFSSSGLRQIYPKKKPVNTETKFDLASLTKVLFTTHQVLKACSINKLALDDPISKYIPDLCQYNIHDAWERKITLKQCLSHSTPFPAVEPFYTYSSNSNNLKNYILQNRWKKHKPVYSDINFIFLGIILERIFRKSIKNIETGYGFNFKPKRINIAATEKCFWRNRLICGETHDENSFALGGAGHAGLFGSINDILEFAYDMLVGRNITNNHLECIKKKIYKNRSCGWEVSNKGWSGGNLCSNETIGHTGFTGTGIWIDFKNKIAWTLLTNRVHPSRHNNSKIEELRVRVGEKMIEVFSRR